MKQSEKEYEIPKGGSLGLLALGDIGLVKWREKRKEIKEQRKEIKKDRTKTKDDE